MDRVISELCYKGTILHWNYRKMTMSWSFSCNSFVKFHGKKFGIHNMSVLYPNPSYNEVCYRLHCFTLTITVRQKLLLLVHPNIKCTYQPELPILYIQFSRL